MKLHALTLNMISHTKNYYAEPYLFYKINKSNNFSRMHFQYDQYEE